MFWYAKATGRIKSLKGTQRVLDEALASKRIPRPMTQDDIKGLFEFVLPGTNAS